MYSGIDAFAVNCVLYLIVCRSRYIYSICSVVLINYFLKHLLQHYKYKYIIFIEDDTEGIIM